MEAYDTSFVPVYPRELPRRQPARRQINSRQLPIVLASTIPQPIIQTLLPIQPIERRLPPLRCSFLPPRPFHHRLNPPRLDGPHRNPRIVFLRRQCHRQPLAVNAAGNFSRLHILTLSPELPETPTHHRNGSLATPYGQPPRVRTHRRNSRLGRGITSPAEGRNPHIAIAAAIAPSPLLCHLPFSSPPKRYTLLP